MADKIPLMDDKRAMFARKNATLTGLHSSSAEISLLKPSKRASAVNRISFRSAFISTEAKAKFVALARLIALKCRFVNSLTVHAATTCNDTKLTNIHKMTMLEILSPILPSTVIPYCSEKTDFIAPKTIIEKVTTKYIENRFCILLAKLFP